MQVSFDNEQVQLLRDTLEQALRGLRVEATRADTRDFKQMLLHREEVLESVLARISGASAAR